MAWVNDCALSSIAPQETGLAAANRLQVLRHESKWQRIRFDRVEDELTFAALEEDDEREEVRESVRTNSILSFEHPVSTSGGQAFLVPDCDSRGDSPGGRRGPPPRMPPA